MRLQNDELDDLYHCLSNQRRRNIIQVVQSSSTPISIHDLSQLIARNEESGEDLEVILYHQHLPLMDEIDVIDFEDSDMISPGDNFENIIELLGNHGKTIKAVCEDCSEEQVISRFGATCVDCGREELTPIE